MSPWRVLGLARTDDVAEIRRAYARKLKAIDVDADPEAFVALRAALNEALWQANEAHYRQLETADADVEADAEAAADPHAAPLPAGPAWTEADPLPDPAPEPPEDDPRNAPFIALERLLFPGEDAPPADPEALAAAVRAILDHPDRDHVDRGAGIEIWLAEALAEAGPRADPVIAMAIDHFGWDGKAGHWDQHWALDALVQRRDAFGLLDRVADPRHQWHKAYLDLVSDRESLGFKTMARANQVGALLGHIRQNSPAAEAYLAPHRVALWDDRLNRSISGGLGWAVLIFWGLFVLAKIFITVSGPSTPNNPLAAIPATEIYADPALDLAPAIEEASQGRLDLAAIRADNPPLYERLVARWERARGGQGQDYMFDGDVRALLLEAARGGLRGGGHAVQSAYWRLRADELIWLRDQGVPNCDAPAGNRPARTLPGTFLDRRTDILAQALAAAPPEPPPALAPGATHSFAIPGPVVETVARRTGLSGAALSDALQGRGPPARICDANIALIEAALALPERRGATLLREMSTAL